MATFLESAQRVQQHAKPFTAEIHLEPSAMYLPRDAVLAAAARQYEDALLAWLTQMHEDMDRHLGYLPRLPHSQGHSTPPLPTD
jgi:hypothetical protein